MPDAVDAQVAQMQKQFEDEAEFTKALAARNATVEQLADAVDMAINKMMEAELASTAAATDADAQDFYAKNPGQVQAGRDGARQPHPREDREGRRRGDEEGAARQDRRVLKRAKAGEDFAALARENSADGSAPRAAISVLPARTDGAAVRSGGVRAEARRNQRRGDNAVGYHIIKLTEKKEARWSPWSR